MLTCSSSRLAASWGPALNASHWPIDRRFSIHEMTIANTKTNGLLAPFSAVSVSYPAASSLQILVSFFLSLTDILYSEPPWSVSIHSAIFSSYTWACSTFIIIANIFYSSALHHLSGRRERERHTSVQCLPKTAVDESTGRSNYMVYIGQSSLAKVVAADGEEYII